MAIIRIIHISLCICLVSTDLHESCSVTPTFVPCSREDNSLTVYFNATEGLCSYASEEPVRMCVASGLRFHDYMSCIHTCLCTQPPPEDRCPEQSTSSPRQSQRWFFNPEGGVCEPFTNYDCVDNSAVYHSYAQFVYKGQGGNANRFASNEECMDQCLCGLEEQDGGGDWTCGAYFETWVYHKKENRCKPFMYGGCGGNSNLFYTKEKCSESCEKH